MRGLIILQMNDFNDSKAKKWATSCAGCKFHRKKCSEKCVLAPYFPHNDLQKFLFVHRVFGNGNVVKLLEALPEEQRSDAVSSLVYEARERFRDPVHGCVGVINDLMKNIADLQSQLASTQAELANVNLQHANLLTLMITGGSSISDNVSLLDSQDLPILPALDDPEPMSLWEQFWS
eukprot:PITA_33283